MASLRDISIKNKLVLMQVFTAVMVLGFCVSAFAVLSIKGYKDRKGTSASAIANVIGANSISSLEFLDNMAARKVLSDLQAETDVVNAAIFDKSGHVFATYTKPGWDASFRFPDPSEEKKSITFAKPYLLAYEKIQKNQETIGWVSIRFELSGLRKIQTEILSLAIALLLVGTGFAFLIAVIVQNYISKPLLNLVSVMQLVESTSDYKVRSDVKRKDEIGALSRGFNDMITTIEKRDNELARSRQQLDQQNLLLNSVIQNMGDGLTVADKNGNVILSNNMGEKIIGVKIPSENWAIANGLFLPDGHTPYQASEIPLIKALRGETPEAIEMFVKNEKLPKGMFITTSARPLKDTSGAITGGVSVFHDITAKKEAEMVIRNSERQLATVYDTVGDIIFVLKIEKEDHYRFVSVNRAFSKITGLSFEKVIGKTVNEVIPPQSLPIVLEKYRKAILEKKTISWEETSEYPSGKLIGEVNITPVFDEKGTCIQLIGSIHDITRQKQIEIEIKKLNEELEKKVTERTMRLAETNEKLESTITQLNASVKEMESFSYTVSHDLRSPIRGINGFTSLLQKKYSDKLDDDGKKMLGTIISEAVRMGHLIDDLLAFSRLGRKEIQKSMVDMTALAHTALEDVLKMADVKYKAKVSINNLPPAFCDSALLQQVFINLISNALKFSATKPEPVIDIGSYEEAHSTIYFIRDNGAGFDMKYYNKLFGVFQRLHSIEEFPGTGIGLSIVHKIIERHGGRVWAEANENEGAIFYFSLPHETSAASKTENETNLEPKN